MSEDDPTKPAGEAWTISFGSNKSRKISKREKAAINRFSDKKMVLPGGETDTANKSDTDEAGGVSSTQDALRVIDGRSLIDLEVAVPRNLQVTQEQMQFRNYIDQQQLMCMCRQYRASCGISSLASVWNNLYSRIGHGALPPVSQEEIMTILGFEPPFETIRWGPFTGNVTLFRWFHAVNRHFGVQGKCYYLWKAHGFGKTFIDQKTALTSVQDAIRSPHCGIVYHCYNHYMVPLGFMDQPRTQIDIFASELPDPDSFIMIGDVSRGKNYPFHVKRWKDVATDIQCQSPNYFNIRKSELGVQSRKSCKRPGNNMHCFMIFRSDQVEEDMARFENEDAEDKLECEEEVDEEEKAQPASADESSTPEESGGEV